MTVDVDHAYCMNLDHRTERWERTRREWPFDNIQLQRVSATYNPKSPRLGTATTFKKIIKDAKDKMTLIIEDDLQILSKEKVITALQNPPSNDWDILLGGVYHYVPLKDGIHTEHWHQLQDFCSLHFIIVRESAYKKILDIPESSNRNIDRQIAELVRQRRLTAFVIHPMPCRQYPGYSDLRKRHVNDNTRRLPWIVT